MNYIKQSNDSNNTAHNDTLINIQSEKHNIQEEIIEQDLINNTERDRKSYNKFFRCIKNKIKSWIFDDFERTILIIMILGIFFYYISTFNSIYFNYIKNKEENKHQFV